MAKTGKGVNPVLLEVFEGGFNHQFTELISRTLGSALRIARLTRFEEMVFCISHYTSVQVFELSVISVHEPDASEASVHEPVESSTSDHPGIANPIVMRYNGAADKPMVIRVLGGVSSLTSASCWLGQSHC